MDPFEDMPFESMTSNGKYSITTTTVLRKISSVVNL